MLPSHDPPASNQSLCGTPVGFMFGTSGGGSRVQCIKSVLTTSRQGATVSEHHLYNTGRGDFTTTHGPNDFDNIDGTRDRHLRRR